MLLFYIWWPHYPHEHWRCTLQSSFRLLHLALQHWVIAKKFSTKSNIYFRTGKSVPFLWLQQVWWRQRSEYLHYIKYITGHQLSQPEHSLQDTFSGHEDTLTCPHYGNKIRNYMSVANGSLNAVWLSKIEFWPLFLSTYNNRILRKAGNAVPDPYWGL